MAHVRITKTPRCVDCGRFIANRDFPISRLHYEPLNEFGPEVIEWTCPPCVERAPLPPPPQGDKP